MLPNQFDAMSDGRVVLNPLFLKRLRQKRGLSQEALAQACAENRLCLSLASIKRAEAGKPVLYRTARHLATFYGTDLALLLITAEAAASFTATVPQIGNMPILRRQNADRRRNVSNTSVIYFTINYSDLSDSLAKLVIDCGARSWPNPARTELAIVFGAPAHRTSDAVIALQCAINLQSSAASAENLFLRRRSLAEVFAEPITLSSNIKIGGSIFLETALANQLSAIAQFESSDGPLAGCSRFLRFNGVKG